MIPVKINDLITLGRPQFPLLLIAGPCVLESRELAFTVAAEVAKICRKFKLPYIFKGSFDKANRSSIEAYRGPGLVAGLEILAAVKSEFKLPVTTDVHTVAQVEAAAKVVDIIQIPAFLCRQTDLLVAAGASGLPVNVKKGQFMAPQDMQQVVNKVASTGNHKLILTERGTTFGYHNLVVDFRAFPLMRSIGAPVIFDATHSVQLPAAQGDCSGGDRAMIPTLAAAAVAAGADGLFMEVHPDPDRALCDGANSLPLTELEPLLQQLAVLSRV
jgi:2-dehydro-3-deoxyphosphooctonate aldolase (KDO 8-P synthase)